MYALRFGGREEYRRGVWSRLAPEIQRRWMPNAQTILDLGAGYCEFINQAQAVERMAMDLNPEVSRRAAAGVRCLVQDCSKPWPLDDDWLDAVFTSNFFEHLPDKAHLERTLAEAFRCLKPGGRLVALGPNIRFVPGAYWDFFDHHIALTERSLAEAFRNRGFLVTEAIPRFLPYTMSEGRQVPLFMVSTYLKLQPAWRWFGRQFLVVGEKPARRPE